MQVRGENMYDVRARLGVKSVQWKIEKRALERVGHVMRMKDESLKKVAVLGWYKKLEGLSKAPGKKRKTVSYRMDHLDGYERQLGHGYVWGDGEERLVRNERRVNEDLRCRYEGCERLCRSKVGLVRHESMMHHRVEGRVRFACEDCCLEVATKGALVGHRRRAGREGGWRTGGGSWGMRSPSILRELCPSRAVLQGWGGGGEVAAVDGWEGTSVGAWVGELVASIVGGLWPSGIWRGTSASPAGCGTQGGGGGPDRGQRWAARGGEGRSELSRKESVNLSLFRWGHHTAFGSWRALVARQESAEFGFCGEENESAQHLWVWCSAFMEDRWRAWFGESFPELVETPLRASALFRAILRCLKWSTTKTAPPRQHLPLRARQNMLCLQRLLIFLYICSTYKIDNICNILSRRALFVDQLSAYYAYHRVHNKPYEHRLHNTKVFPKMTTESHSLRQGSSSFHCLPSVLFSPLQLHTC